MDQQNQPPRFHPISALPMIASSLTGQLAQAQSLSKTLLKAEAQPHLLDDPTVDRIIRVYTETLEHVSLYDEQILRWKNSPLVARQLDDVDRLIHQASALRLLCQDILDRAAALRRGTIDRILEMSDEEIALKVQTGELKPPTK